MTDDELREMLQRGESDLLELKKTISDLDKIRATACAFANDFAGRREPGLIVVGLNDDGSCAATSIDDALLLQLGEVREGTMLPTPSLVVERRKLDGCEVALLFVYPHAAPPVRYRGRAYVRVGPRTQTASLEDERRLIERRRVSTLPFDHQPVPGATVDDLLLGDFKTDYLPVAFDRETLAANGRSVEGQLAALRFATGDGTPTVGGILAFGVNPERWIPSAFVQFVRFDGEELTDPIRDEKRLSGALPALLTSLDDILKLGISTRVEIAARREVREPDYPISALRQLIRNAVMHRAYDSSNAPIRVSWFNDRIEIQNPGGLFGQVNPSNFGTVTDYRNPLVAEAMRALGFVQRFGVGIATAQKSLRENGNPEPEFEFSPTSVLVKVRSKQ